MTTVDAQPVAALQVVETHVSWLFFCGDRVIKVKKPIRTDFLDFSSRERRAAACRREVELNRRLSPDVYLDLLDVVGADGTPYEHAVLMRRLPAARRLATLVAAGADVRADVRRVAAKVAALHARAPRSAAIDRAGRPETLRGLWEENLGVLADQGHELLDAATLTRVRERAHRYLIGRTALLERRIAAGSIVDGHGDLLAEDIFCLPDGPRILDCIEFDDQLRYGDVLLDVAFLAMDLERLGAPAEAAAFLDDYRQVSGVDHPASLAHWYIAYRAVVRAKVACLRYAQYAAGGTDPGSSDGQPTDRVAAAAAAATNAAELVRLADRHLSAGRVRMVLVGGLPGTGKSTIAQALGGRLGWPVLRSDVIRQQLSGGPVGAAAPGGGSYHPQWTGATYGALLDRAAEHLAMGESVLLDASWTDPVHRSAATRLARRAAADLVTLECSATPELALARIGRRQAGGHDPSDADADVYRYLADRAVPWPEAAQLDTGRPLADTLADALRAIEDDLVPAPRRTPGPGRWSPPARTHGPAGDGRQIATIGTAPRGRPRD